jgi:ATP-dependent RNA helicase MSS116
MYYFYDIFYEFVVTQIDVLAQLISQQRSLPLHKVIVFFPTARHAGYLAELFNAAEVPVLEIHSRKSQVIC